MESFIDFLKKRATSTFLVSYSAFWVAYHWEGIITLFATSQDLIMTKYGLLKNEYIAKYFFGIIYNNEWDWGLILWKIGGFIVPLILAYIYVWWLPKWILNPSYKKEVNYRIDRRIIKNEAEKRLVKSETKKVESKIELLEKQEEMHDIDPEIDWELDFDKYLSTNGMTGLDALANLKEVIYAQSGWVEWSGNIAMSSTELMLCDTNELIRFEGDIDGQDTSRVSLTEKGKFFLKEWSKYLKLDEK